jgi:hypothetical protein
MSPEPLVPSQQHHEGLLAGWVTASDLYTPEKMLRTLRRDSRRAECQLLEPQTQRLDAAGRIDRACRTAVDMYTNLEKPCSRIYRACRTAVDMYTNLEKLAALRYCYDLGGCVTVKIASIQGSKRLTFCSATEHEVARRKLHARQDKGNSDTSL